jgi:hypothetical protein
MQIQDLVDAAQAPTTAVLAALYAIVRADPTADPMTIINPGVSEAELDKTERRIHHPLHLAHRALLRSSNGGTIPFVISVGFVAAAIAREREWRWHVPPPPADRPTVDQGAGDGPFTPLILGESLAGSFDSRTLKTLDLDTFIVLAAGDNGEFYGYARGDPDRMDVVSQDFGRDVEASDFETFIRSQLLATECESTGFIKRVRALVHEL